MFGAVWREAAEDDACDATRLMRDLRRHRSDGDACGAFRRKSIDAGRDRRKCDRTQALSGSERKRSAITRRQQFFLALLAAAPNRAYGVNDVLGFQPKAAGHLG